MINFLFGKYIRAEVAKEVAKINSSIDAVDDKIKQHCVTLIKSMFSDEAPIESYVSCGWVSGYFRKNAKGELEQGVANIVTKNMIENESNRVNAKLAGEEFIDGIVERIRNKQIK
jgi:hypothetical protein